MPRFPTRSRRGQSLFSSSGPSPAGSLAGTEVHVGEIHAAHLPRRAGPGRGRAGQCYRESAQLAHELSAAGQYLAAAPLEPTAAATSVRVRKGKRVVTDGPFAETKEQLGGYFLIDASDLDEAIAIAARIPVASRGTIEVRPVVHIPDLPAD